MKTRKQGNSIVLTVPKEFGIKENEEFVPFLYDGAITYLPKVENIYKKAREEGRKIEVENLWDDDYPQGKEDI